MTQVFQSSGTLQLVRFEMPLADFPGCLTLGIGTNGRLANTEMLARALIANDFEPALSIEFVKAVCLWGDDPRRAGKVIIRNSADTISNALRQAHISSSKGQIAEALRAITSLEGLAVSFGSKHLKFLDPNRHVVLDSILSERLGYTRDLEGTGYLRWLEACHEYLEIVRSAGVAYPGIGQNGWRVSDIEMAIFVKVRSE